MLVLIPGTDVIIRKGESPRVYSEGGGLTHCWIVAIFNLLEAKMSYSKIRTNG